MPGKGADRVFRSYQKRKSFFEPSASSDRKPKINLIEGPSVSLLSESSKIKQSQQSARKHQAKNNTKLKSSKKKADVVPRLKLRPNKRLNDSLEHISSSKRKVGAPLIGEFHVKLSPKFKSKPIEVIRSEKDIFHLMSIQEATDAKCELFKESSPMLRSPKKFSASFSSQNSKIVDIGRHIKTKDSEELIEIKSPRIKRNSQPRKYAKRKSSSQKGVVVDNSRLTNFLIDPDKFYEFDCPVITHFDHKNAIVKKAKRRHTANTANRLEAFMPKIYSLALRSSNSGVLQQSSVTPNYSARNLLKRAHKFNPPSEIYSSTENKVKESNKKGRKRKHESAPPKRRRNNIPTTAKISETIKDTKPILKQAIFNSSASGDYTRKTKTNKALIPSSGNTNKTKRKLKVSPNELEGNKHNETSINASKRMIHLPSINGKTNNNKQEFQSNF